MVVIDVIAFRTPVDIGTDERAKVALHKPSLACHYYRALSKFLSSIRYAEPIATVLHVTSPDYEASVHSARISYDSLNVSTIRSKYV